MVDCNCGYLFIISIMYVQVRSMTTTTESDTVHEAIQKLKQELKQLYNDQLAELNSRVTSLEQENTALKKRQLSQSGAGFTAVNYERITYTDGEIMQFEVELYDGNNNYDHTTGIYTCPADGMYLFSFEIYGLNDVGCSYCLSMGTTEMSCSYSPGAGDGTASLVTHCAAGTPISVRASLSGTTPYGEYEGDPLSSFSGVLIAIDA